MIRYLQQKPAQTSEWRKPPQFRANDPHSGNAVSQAQLPNCPTIRPEEPPCAAADYASNGLLPAYRVGHNPPRGDSKRWVK